MGKDYALYLIHHYWLQGEPLPVDTFITVTGMGIDPCEIEERFEDGETLENILKEA